MEALVGLAEENQQRVATLEALMKENQIESWPEGYIFSLKARIAFRDIGATQACEPTHRESVV